MSVSRVCAVVLMSMLLVPGPARGQQAEPQRQQQSCTTSIPANIQAGLLAADTLALLRLSETFRSQCERVAADPRVRVSVSIAMAGEIGGRAQTTFRRYRSGALLAEVEVRFGESYRELLAHEFEHVIEQIEGLDLRQEAAVGRAWLVSAGTFETRRALLAGVQVLQEAEALHAHAPVSPQPTR